MKIAEWPPPSVNYINSKARLCGLIRKKLSEEKINKPGGWVKNLEGPQSNLLSLQTV